MILMKSFFYTQCFFILIMVVGILGQRFGVLPLKVALGTFAIALMLALVVSVMALVFFILSFVSLPTSMRFPALAAFSMGMLPVLSIIMMAGPGLKVPQIHDISTDLENNIAFSNAQRLRKAGENSLERPSNKVLELQAGYYTALEPLVVVQSPPEAYAIALEAAKSLSWTIEHEAPEAGTFEATEKTRLFAFVDDVVVRVSAIEQGSVIDTRSVSRVGKSDLGANAKRIEAFQAAYQALADKR
ncbi:MAG: DUF1499 domain-containing protein [Agarilytica sp.]